MGERIKLFEQALGIEWPWYVERTEFDAEGRRLDVHLNFEVGGTFACAGCGAEGCKAYDTKARSWRHMDFLPAPGLPPRSHAAGPLRGVRGSAGTAVLGAEVKGTNASRWRPPNPLTPVAGLPPDTDSLPHSEHVDRGPGLHRGCENRFWQVMAPHDAEAPASQSGSPIVTGH